jgi:hypothetical protein
MFIAVLLSAVKHLKSDQGEILRFAQNDTFVQQGGPESDQGEILRFAQNDTFVKQGGSESDQGEILRFAQNETARHLPVGQEPTQ